MLLLIVSAPVLLFVRCGTSHGDGGGTASSCVGPYLNDQPPSGPFRGPTPTVSPGGSITVHGHWYTSTCNDTGSHDPLVPLARVHLTLVLPGGATEELGEFEAHGRDMGFSAVVQVPVGTPPGTAIVRDDQPDPVTYTFDIGP